jgi:elongation factor Ts
MQVKIEDIKKLREKTGAGIADCRQALEETKGDLKAAEEVLRKKGIQKAEKKAERQVKAGMVFAYVHHTGRLGAMVGLACETDFVAKTDDFQKLGKELAMQVAAANPADVKELLEQEYIRDPGKKVAELIKETIGKLGENIQVMGLEKLTV